MTPLVLRVGDQVKWRGGWGRLAPQSATVERIVVGGPTGTEVPAVPWSGVNGRNVIVDLSNGHWAYGFQIKPETAVRSSKEVT